MAKSNSSFATLSLCLLAASKREPIDIDNRLHVCTPITFFYAMPSIPDLPGLPVPRQSAQEHELQRSVAQLCELQNER